MNSWAIVVLITFDILVLILFQPKNDVFDALLLTALLIAFKYKVNSGIILFLQSAANPSISSRQNVSYMTNQLLLTYQKSTLYL